jgi:hypothetical protein
MKLSLSRISLFAVKAQRIFPIALTVLSVIALTIGMNPPEGGGGIGG